MEALTALQREYIEGVRDCFNALLDSGFKDDAERGIQIVRGLPSTNASVITIGKAAYFVWDNGENYIPMIFSEVSFKTLTKEKHAKAVAAFKECGILFFTGISNACWVKKAPPAGSPVLSKRETTKGKPAQLR